MRLRSAFTLIELLVVIAIIAILAVVVVLTLNPAQLLAQSRDASRVSDMATLQSALDLYTTDQSGNLQLGSTTATYISVPDASSTSCADLGMLSLSSSSWACSSNTNYRLSTSTGWIGVNFNLISSGSPFGSEPVDPVNQTSSGLFYAYNTNGSQFQVTANLESSKYKSQYGSNPSTSLFPEVISGGTPGISAIYNPTGLVGYWPLNEGVGSTTIDQSGNGNNGTWAGKPNGNNGTYYVGGKVGTYAASFGGGYPYYTGVSLGNPIALQSTGAMTIAAWIYAPTTNEYSYIIANNANIGTGPFHMYTGASGTSGNRCFFNSTGVGTNSLPPNSWYDAACTWDGSIITLYINGQIMATTSFMGPLSYSNGWPWWIGGDGTSTPTNNFLGAIDDIRIYNRALSPAEVMALYNAEK